MSADQQESGPYQDGKRAGVHPALVVFGVIAGLWIFIWAIVPSSKSQRQQQGLPDPARDAVTADEAPVMFRVGAAVPEANAVGLVVPEQATASQIVGLLTRLKDARRDNKLGSLLPPTTPGHQLGDHAIARVYIFSSAKYATPEAIKVLARGAHAPGALYPDAIPFEEAMEQVRGYYQLDLRDAAHPELASIGFADESGVHSTGYKRVF